MKNFLFMSPPWLLTTWPLQYSMRETAPRRQRPARRPRALQRSGLNSVLNSVLDSVLNVNHDVRDRRWGESRFIGGKPPVDAFTTQLPRIGDVDGEIRY